MTFQPRMLSAGRPCCSSEHALCDACRAHFGLSLPEYLARQRHHLDEALGRRTLTSANVDTRYAPINGYEPHLAKLRAASSTPERDFEDSCKAERLRALEAEYARRAADREANPEPRLTAAEAAELASRYAPPNSYEAGLKALREGKQR